MSDIYGHFVIKQKAFSALNGLVLFPFLYLVSFKYLTRKEEVKCMNISFKCEMGHHMKPEKLLSGSEQA